MNQNKRNASEGEMTPLHSIRERSAAPLRRHVSRRLKRIRDGYVGALREQESGKCGEWLRDNYHMLEKEALTVMQELRGLTFPCDEKEGKLPLLFDFCLKLVEQEKALPGFPALDATLMEYQKRRKLQLSEFTHFSLMMRAALLEVAFRGCTAKGSEGVELLACAVKGLRNLDGIDFDLLMEEHSEVVRMLRRDPAGAYDTLDERTRHLYLRLLAQRSKQEGTGELFCVRTLLEKARNATEERERHVGYYLMEQQKHPARGKAFLIAEGVVGLAISLLFAWLAGNFWLTPLLFFPLWEGFRGIVETLSLYRVPPLPLPRLETGDRVPDNAPTLVTVSILLPPADKAEKLYDRLQRLYHTNPDGPVYFCLLADLKTASLPSLPEDGADMAAARAVVRRLNSQLENRFYLVVRKRRFSPTEGEYTGYERKRGAIGELVDAIKEGNDDFLCLEGDTLRLREMKYILALDSDTGLLMNSACEMVGAALHPLNQPVLKEDGSAVRAGYGIIAPRVEVDLSSANATSFARIMAGAGGVSSYENTTSERYQDLFGEGIFAGKGLLDVDAFHTVMKNRLPEGIVLSHDILEGGFLRTAFLSDVQVTDGFPLKELSYHSRLHRWIRGDWQNLRFLGSRYRVGDKEIHNALTPLSKYKLFDNLRRSVTPILCVLLFLLACFLPHRAANYLAVAGILGSVGCELFCALRSLLGGGLDMLSRRYYSGTLPAAMSALVRAMFTFTLLPLTAWLSLDAIVRALYRQLISKRRLLQWRTAAESEGDSHRLRRHLLHCLPSLLVGALLCFPREALGVRLIGIAFLLSVPLTLLSTRLTELRKISLEKVSREKLLSYAAAMWRYYEEYCGPLDNYLPPDNVQLAPVFRIAHRTSPTNIGMLLLSCLAARDFGFIDSQTLCSRLEQTVSTVERLEKFAGHLLNWYDTRSLQPLSPRYVSTVDSGNFLCCLVALQEGLKEYLPECSGLSSLCARLKLLEEGCDLAVLYNKRRKLFRIGYNVDKNENSPSYYDLLMSESRMTSYYAVAARLVPKKHWGSLGRTLAREGGFTGCVSWTGTMFEYFMPHILLPAYQGSLQYEALRFCVYCQKKRVKKRGVPWGISESGFYAFDAPLNYQYKAHGVQKLGLKRGLNHELVVSPYSTFLTLPFSPKSSLENLQRLEEYRITGHCGFYEAVDFTRRRISDRDYAVIRSYMAHHVGMSLLSVCNILKDNIMQQRFMRDHRMEAANELLEEKIPVGAVVFEDAELREIPARPMRVADTTGEFTAIDPANPRVHLLTNGEWSLAASDCGASLSLYRGLDITRRSGDLLRRPQGIFAVVQGEEESLPLTFAPVFDEGPDYSARLSRTSLKWSAVGERLEGNMTAHVHPLTAGEQRTITVKNRTKNPIDVTVTLYLEPCLAPWRDDAAHPMFSKLFLESRYHEESKALVFTRRCRQGEQPMSLAMGFSKQQDFTFDTARDSVLIRPLSLAGLDLSAEKELRYKGYSPDPCAAFQLRLSIPPHMTREVRFMMCAASTPQEALHHLLEVRGEKEMESAKAAGTPFLPDSLEDRLMAKVLPKLLYPVYDCEEIKMALRAHDFRLEQLWSLGISGDYPIVLMDVDSPDEAASVLPMIRLNQRLTICGLPFDLVLLTRDEGAYDKPVNAVVSGYLTDEGCENSLGARGGIHLVDPARHGEECLPLLMAAACYYSSPKKNVEYSALPYRPLPILPVQAVSDEENGFTSEGHYVMNHPTLSPFCVVLANPDFGSLVGNGALGCSWAVNSRENKLTPWFNDVASDNRGEMLLARVEDRIYDLCYGASCEFAGDTAYYRGSFEGISYTLTLRVPQKGMRKVLELRCESKQERTVQLAFYTEPLLSADSRSAHHLKANWEEDVLFLSNHWNGPDKGEMYLYAGRGSRYCCNRSAFLSGDWSSRELLPMQDGCAALIHEIKVHASETTENLFVLGYTKDHSVNLLPPTEEEMSPQYLKNSIQVQTPDETLNHLVNLWLPLQIFGSRIFGRTGFYQSGGAYGFRDQLQDVCGIITIAPDVAKQQILRAAMAQFPEGDVLHWWHELPDTPGGVKGVRTRYSDDLLWLPYVVCQYVKRTGDKDILQVELPYVEGPELLPNEHEKYFTPSISEKKESLYQHCMNSINRAVRLGEHRLPLIGGGDWNDGFNLVGIKGKGESVWLAQFLSIVMKDMSELAPPHTAENLLAGSEALLQAVDEFCWDGKWYGRAFFDSGASIGTSQSVENKLDSLTQSFSVLADMPDSDRRRSALDQAMAQLVDQQKGVIRLFAPAFTGKGENPGYISAYPSGMRENSGQYTHAAVWLAMAMLQEGRIEEGYRLIQILNPALKYMDESLSKIYKREPYALCGDVSYHPDIKGQGGWSLYTGAAGWYYRVIVEELLGIQVENGAPVLHPKIPAEWEGYDATIVYNGITYDVKVDREKAILEEREKAKENSPLTVQ